MEKVNHLPAGVLQHVYVPKHFNAQARRQGAAGYALSLGGTQEMKMKIRTIIIFLFVSRTFGCSSSHNLAEYPSEDNQMAQVVLQRDTIAFIDSNDVNGSPPDAVLFDVEPIAIQIIAPVYPPLELVFGNEAEVYVKVWVTKQGNVKKVVILKSTNESFNNSSIEAASRWVFKPAIMKGKPVSAWVVIPFRFRMKRGCAAS